MKLEADSVLPYERELVFTTQRDGMEQIAPYLPNVRSLRVEERKVDGPVVHLVNRWEASARKIPEALAQVMKEDMIVWRDYASWDRERWLCDWSIRSEFFGEAVSCAGTITFVALDGGRTRIETRGDLRIDLRKKVRALPDMLAGPVGRLVEQFMVRQITANMLGVSPGLSRYLEETSKVS